MIGNLLSLCRFQVKLFVGGIVAAEGGQVLVDAAATGNDQGNFKIVAPSRSRLGGGASAGPGL